MLYSVKKYVEKNTIIFFLSLLDKVKIWKKVKYLKGPHCKIRTPIRWKFYGDPGRKTFFLIKRSSKLALEIRKIICFK